MNFRQAFALLLLLAPLWAHAQTSTGDSARDEARRFYSEGMTHMKRKDYAAAHRAFAKANVLYEASTIKLQYALCLEKEGKLEDAKALLRELIASPPKPGDSQPLKEAYAKGISELARMELKAPTTPALPAPLPPQAAPAVPVPTPTPTPAQAPPAPLLLQTPPLPPAAPTPAAAPSQTAQTMPALPARNESPYSPPRPAAMPPEPSAKAPRPHSVGLLLGLDLGGATGDSRTDTEGVVGLHGGIYLLRNVYAGGRIGWYGSAAKSARSSSQHFEFGMRLGDNGLGIAVSGLLGARKVESWTSLYSSTVVTSSTQTEVGAVLGRRFALGANVYVAPEIALLYCKEDPATSSTLQTTAAQTRLYLGVAGDLHLGL